MRNARLDDSQAGIKIAGTDINNFRYADDTTLMAENKRGTTKKIFTTKIITMVWSLT